MDVDLVALLDILLETLVSCWKLLICKSRDASEIFLDKHGVGELARALLWNLVVSDQVSLCDGHAFRLVL